MKLEYAREEREEREKIREERKKEREEERLERQRLEHELELKKLEYSRENKVVNQEKSSGFNFYTPVKCVPKFDEEDVQSSFIALENMAHQPK